LPLSLCSVSRNVFGLLHIVKFRYCIIYAVILLSYVIVNFGTGCVSRDDVTRGRCSYKRNSEVGRVVPNCFNQDV